MSLDRLEALRQRFRTRCVADRHAIQVWLDNRCGGSREIEGIIHNLAGAAGTFGYPEIHRIAAQMDDQFRLRQHIKPGDVLALLEALDAALSG